VLRAIMRALIAITLFCLLTVVPKARMQASLGILFSSDRDGEGNFEIYVMDSDGNNVRRLTNHPAIDAEPVWSPDQQRIAFSSNRERNYSIYVMNADGSNPRRLTPDDGSSYVSPTWSPDGKYIAFTSDRSGTNGIYWVSADGGELQALAGSSGEDTEPSWAPDCRIFFSSSHDGVPGIYTMNSDGSNARRLVPNNGTDDTYPTSSPSGQYIAYVASAGFSSELYTVGADGAEANLLTGVYEKFILSPAWSPDERSLVYALSEPGGKSVIIKVSVDGSATVQLTASESNAREPSWAAPRSSGAFNCSQGPMPVPATASSCPGAPASRLDVGERGQVTPGVANNVRRGPSLRSGKIGSIPGGGVFMVIEGPTCADSYAWWKVNYQGLIGWTAEGVHGDYWLEPVSVTPSSPSEPGGGELCGSVPRRFHVGEVVVVSRKGDGLRILTRVPGGARQAIDQGSPYNQLRIDGGPVCESLGSIYGEESWYYYIYSFADGVSGWVADGPSWERWLCPLTDQECDR